MCVTARSCNAGVGLVRTWRYREAMMRTSCPQVRAQLVSFPVTSMDGKANRVACRTMGAWVLAIHAFDWLMRDRAN